MNTITASPGSHSPLGLKIKKNQYNFAIFSTKANSITLGIFKDSQLREFPMEKTGDIFHLSLTNLPSPFDYAFKVDTSNWILDPYKKYTADDFDWKNTSAPKIPKDELILYEMHIRGFTKDPSSNVQHPGTFLSMIEKIPHLKKLGVNAVELMPIFEFDEKHSYWGYDTLSYFCPSRVFAASESPAYEFKQLVKELHKNGIKVILDVVFNHTAEGSPFHVLDKSTYYMIDSSGNYKNFSGCGNTLNCNNEVVRQFILDCLMYWIDEMHVDGFRFDLACILMRSIDGNVMDFPPIVESITDLCKSKDVLLIAEAWDATGLYQVGLFPNKWKHWADWNGKYRDRVRNFIRGTPNSTKDFVDALYGTPSIYKNGGSVNFITAHDGFTMRDLVSYESKQNFANGEENCDGSDHNHSWNCGIEGPTSDPKITDLREKQMRNFFLTLFLSKGTPMLRMGDEYGHTCKGNNNPYNQDNRLNWFCWDTLVKNGHIFSFVAKLIAFRKKYGPIESFKLEDEKDHYCAISYKDFLVAFNASSNPVTLTFPKGKWHKVLNTEDGWEKHFLTDLTKAPLFPQQIEIGPQTAILAHNNCPKDRALLSLRFSK